MLKHKEAVHPRHVASKESDAGTKLDPVTYPANEINVMANQQSGYFGCIQDTRKGTEVSWERS